MKSLRECTTLQEAETLLKGAKPSLRKIVEMGFALKDHPNQTQRNISDQLISTAIREMDGNEMPTPKHDDGIKSKGDHFVKEEELSGGNKTGTEGSEQSTDNTPPYPQEGSETEDGQKDMKKATGTENQFSEMMPQMQQGGMPGMDPQIAQQMGQGMPQLPPFSPQQSMQQMQYTVREYLKPIYNKMAQQETTIKYQVKAIKDLNAKLQETINLRGGLDLNSTRDRSVVVPSIQETIPSTVTNLNPQAPKIFEKTHQLEQKRARITEMNKMMENQPYK